MRLLHKLALAIVLMSLLVMLLPISVAVADDVVTFPDPNLEAAIREAIGKPTGEIYQSDLNGLTEFFPYSRGITNISGLEHCTNLTNLSLRYNQISNISPVAGLTNLTWLALDSNQISDISPVAGLTNLTQLGFCGNQISDISPVAGLTNLTVLGIGVEWGWMWDGNNVSDMSPVAGLTNLTVLYFSYNQISDISPLVHLTSLTRLFLEHNQISDISPLAGLTNLWDLYLSSNQISDISPLVANQGLAQGDYVELSRNPLGSDSLYVYIPQLQARGVTVYYDAPTPTPTPTPTGEAGGGGGGGGGGGCFIATAAYGSSLDSHVDTLRSFRDQYLETNPIGSAFVSLYYKVSPPMADFINEHPALKPIVRAGLVPAVVMSTVAVDTTPVEKIAIALVILTLLFVMRERKRAA